MVAISEGRRRPAKPPGADEARAPGFAWAARILGRVTDHFLPASVLDVGCGRGVLLAAARDVLGIADIQGIGDPETADLLVSARAVAPFPPDLAFDLGRRYGLVSAFEVAHQIEPSRAEDFVARLARHGDAIAFSAAIPGQDGVEHANPQFLEFWQERFAAQGYALVDLFRPVFWADESMPLWCRQNLVLFVDEGFAARFPWTALYRPDGRVSMVHPTEYRDRLATARRQAEQLEQQRHRPEPPPPVPDAGDAVRRQLDATERYALLGLGQRRAGDRAAFQYFAAGTVPAQEWLDLLDLFGALPAEMQQKVTKQLVGEGLVALSALMAEAFLRSGTNRKPLIEACSISLHYIGFGERALAMLDESGLTKVDRSALAIAVGILIDREAFAEARETIARSGVDQRSKALLGRRVDGVEAATERLAQLPHGAENDVFVVNLLQDAHRRQAFTARFAQLGMRHRVARAVRVDDIPAELIPLLRVSVDSGLDGSFGNQLSQYRTWKAIAAGERPYGIVLEDDGYVRYRGLSRLSFEALAPDADIVFLNDRLAPAMTDGEDGAVGLDPLEDVLAARSFREPEAAALGSDGYVLSRRGAEKLVHIAEMEGFHTVGTDWYLVCHAFDYRRLDAINGQSVMAEVLRSWSARVEGLGSTRLKGFVMRPALVEHRPLGTWRSGRVYL